MSFDTTASDRVQVRSQGELKHPGACALCGSGNCDEGYLDVGVYYDYEGQMYFCMSHCVKQMITVAGGLPMEEAFFINGQCNELIRKNADLTAELEAANELNAQWTAVVNSTRSINLTTHPLTVPNGTSSVEDAPQASESLTESESGLVGQVSEPTKPSAGKRPPKPSKPTASNGPGFSI